MRRSRTAGAIGAAALLLAALPALPASLDVQAVAGLPHISFGGNGQAAAWRSVGVLAQGKWIDVDIRSPTCLSVVASGTEPRSGPPCASADDRVASLYGASHDAAVTLKLPRWHDSLPWVDLSLHQWRSPLGDRRTPNNGSGSAGAITLTRTFHGVDIDAGMELPIRSYAGSARWRTAFAGASWRASTGASLAISAERSVDLTRGDADRSVTFRLAKQFGSSDGRAALWITRSFDATTAPWRATLGVDVAF